MERPKEEINGKVAWPYKKKSKALGKNILVRGS